MGHFCADSSLEYPFSNAPRMGKTGRFTTIAYPIYQIQYIIDQGKIAPCREAYASGLRRKIKAPFFLKKRDAFVIRCGKYPYTFVRNPVFHIIIFGYFVKIFFKWKTYWVVKMENPG
jgi:hypothetical protein